MERIHKKSALAETSPLLLAAQEAGAPLAWERYERQLPLCGFTGNGLSCRKCFQGPCRINPFGDEPSRGVCGADRDQIAMETLFQATLEGVLETARTLAALPAGAGEELPDLAAGLPAPLRERLTAAGLLPVRKTDLFGVRNGFFSHKGYLRQSTRDLARLGLIQHGLLCQGAAAESGGATPDPRRPNLLIVGQLPAPLLEALERAGRPANCFVHGGLRRPGLTPAADPGSPELLLGMRVDALLVAPDAGWPSLEGLAAKYGIPVLAADGGKSPERLAAEALDLAAHHAQDAFYGGAARGMEAAPAGLDPSRVQAIREALAAGRTRGVAVLFGEVTVQQTGFERTLALLEAALGEGALLLLGGELGSLAGPLAAELSRRQGERFAAAARALAADGLSPIVPFGAAELPRVVSLLHGLEARTPVAVAFPEFYRASTWAGAAALVSLGFAVQIGVRLPFWGSPWLAQTLPKEWEKLTGGRLLAPPALPEARVQAEELARTLRAGSAG